MDTYNEIWNAVLDYCSSKVTNPEYKISSTGLDLWVRTIKFGGYQDNKIILIVTDGWKKDIVVNNYEYLILEAIENVMGFPAEIEYRVVPEKRNTGISPGFQKSLDEMQKDFEKFSEQYKKPVNKYNPQFTFETFIEGPSNKFAYRASQAVAKDPGGHITKDKAYGNYNPLFIHGKSGLGKTHILNAICYYISDNYPEMKILYARAEDFANEFINALGRKTVDDFRRKYRHIDVLLLDDIQFIAGKESTEEEFFHTFNTLIENGKQIVLTADRAPRDIQSLTERLCSRFEYGILADIQSPEYETRCAIIKNKAQLLDFDIPDEVVSYIADKIKTNIRQLEGTTKKLQAMSNISGVSPTIPIAQQVIKDVINEEIPPVPVTIQHILEEVSRTEGVTPDDIRSSKQTADISRARKMCMYIIREVTTLTYKQIGAEFKKDYSTVIYGIKEITKIMKNDSKLERKINDIINNVKIENF